MNNHALVIYENRKENEIAIKLLIKSVIKFCEPIDIHLFYSPSTTDFYNWCNDAGIELHKEYCSHLSGWNAKPEILLWGLERKYSRVIFLDSDIILSRSWPQLLTKSAPKNLVVAQLSRSSRKHTQQYVRAWKLKKGKSFLRGISGCVISASIHHKSFLEEWKTMLQLPKYQSWQNRPYNERPIYAVGSDAILTALLGSSKYKNLKIKFVKNGIDIAQCLSPAYFSWDHRLMTLIRGNPPLIHAMGPKPWLTKHENYIPTLAISPYSCAARNLLNNANEPIPNWLEVSPPLETQVKIFKNHVSLSSLPNSIGDHLKRFSIKTFISTIIHYIKTVLNHG